VVQVLASGGPQPESAIEFSAEQPEIGNINQGGLIEGSALGQTIITARAVGQDTHSRSVVYSQVLLNKFVLVGHRNQMCVCLNVCVFTCVCHSIKCLYQSIQYMWCVCICIKQCMYFVYIFSNQCMYYLFIYINQCHHHHPLRLTSIVCACMGWTVSVYEPRYLTGSKPYYQCKPISTKSFFTHSSQVFLPYFYLLLHKRLNCKTQSFLS